MNRIALQGGGVTVGSLAAPATSEETWQLGGCPPDQVVGRTLHGSEIATFDDLYTALAREFSFPSYFGRNLNALRDSMTDLEWLPACGYVVVFTDADRILRDEGEDGLRILLDVLMDIQASWAAPVEDGEWWDRSSVPMAVVLLARSEKAVELLATVREWGFPVHKIERT